MKKVFGFLLLVSTIVPVGAQGLRPGGSDVAGTSEATAVGQLLTLDSCRAMALRNNKQLSISRAKREVAANLKKSARTKYLPHVNAIGTYQHTNREVSLLSNSQRNGLNNLGTAIASGLQERMATAGEQLPMEQVDALLGQMGLSMEGLQQMNGENLQQIAAGLNAQGHSLAEALRTDTRNLWAGSVVLTQPVFLGGSIIAMNKMADISVQMMENGLDAERQSTIYATDQAYWQVISLCHKQKLAEAYLELVRKLDADVHKMIDEGVATRSDGLSVDVKVNEAEMTLTKVYDGLVLSKMLLCQTIGLPINEQVTLADENSQTLDVLGQKPAVDMDVIADSRPELRMLSNTVDLSHQLTNVLKAGNLPQVALTGGYSISNPNLLNGFEKKFGGFWNVGFLVRIPVWNWGDVMYKVRASKGATTIATLELAEAREKVELQVNQTSYQVDEACKRLALAESSIRQAEENLRTANIGFSEGVITPATVMEAQTAWLQAQSQRIDAEIDVRLSQVNFRKALGQLEVEY